LRDFFCIGIFYASALCLHIEFTDSMIEPIDSMINKNLTPGVSSDNSKG